MEQFTKFQKAEKIVTGTPRELIFCGKCKQLDVRTIHRCSKSQPRRGKLHIYPIAATALHAYLTSPSWKTRRRIVKN